MNDANVQRPTPNAQRSSVAPVYDLEDRLLEYAVMVIRLVERIPRTMAETEELIRFFAKSIQTAKERKLSR